MSTTTVAINKIKEDLDSISGLDGGVGEYVEALQKDIHARVAFLNKWMREDLSDEASDNPPLTEEQIRGMVGKWVWIEDYVIPKHSGWDKIAQLREDPIEGYIVSLRHTQGATLKWIGKEFDIYAHEPKQQN